MKKYTSKTENSLKQFTNSIFFKDMITAIRTNGKSKSADDYNILEEYVQRFNENPNTLKITHDDCDVFLYDNLKNSLINEFKSAKILFTDSEFDLKSNKYLINREVWYIDDGYILNLWITESKHVYANPKLDIKMKENEPLIDSNSLLIPPKESLLSNETLEKNIINCFKLNIVKEYERNMVGMISVDGSGELFVKDFSLDKKFKINDLDIHYGDNFKNYHNDLFKKLKGDKKGLILLHGDPGTGKTYYIRYLLQQLSRTKKKVLYFPPSMIETVTDPMFFNFITNWTIENGKNSILLIEDAEPLLVSRESNRNMGITNLLNLTDGILNDILSIQIIATFNTSLHELDKALLRPERLIARKEFKKLSINNAKKLAEIIGIDPKDIDKEMSLADIYSIKNNNEVILHGVDKEQKSIGFRL